MSETYYSISKSWKEKERQARIYIHNEYIISNGKFVDISSEKKNTLLFNVINDPESYVDRISDNFLNAGNCSIVNFLFRCFKEDKDNIAIYTDAINKLLKLGFNNKDASKSLFSDEDIFINAVNNGVKINDLANCDYELSDFLGKMNIQSFKEIIEKIVNVEWLRETFIIKNPKKMYNFRYWQKPEHDLIIRNRISTGYKHALDKLLKAEVVDKNGFIRRIFPFYVGGGHTLMFDTLEEYVGCT
jgi:hypothetical protein